MRRCFLDAAIFIISELTIKDSCIETFQHMLHLCMEVGIVDLLIAGGPTSMHYENMPSLRDEIGYLLCPVTSIPVQTYDR